MSHLTKNKDVGHDGVILDDNQRKLLLMIGNRNAEAGIGAFPALAERETGVGAHGTRTTAEEAITVDRRPSDWSIKEMPPRMDSKGAC